MLRLITAPNLVCAALVAFAAAVILVSFLAGDPAAGPGGVAIAAALLIAAIGGVGRVLGAWLEPLLSACGVLALALAAYGVVATEPVLIGTGLASLIVVAMAAALIVRFGSTVPGTPPAASPARPAELRGGSVQELLGRIHEHSMLSDTAKRVLFRDRELQLLRSVIEDDIHRGDFSAALRLCDDMANLFGYREEAETFRSRINGARRENYQAQVSAALEQLEAHLRERDWPRAHDVAARMRRLFPDSHVVIEIDQRITRARDEHKAELEHAFLDAAGKEDVEVAMQRLRELDRYLSPEEAERLAAQAQSVVTRHRENLSVQFKLAVNDHRWADAARVGEAIMTEFPNAKMAEEVRSMIDVLRTRATQAAVAKP